MEEEELEDMEFNLLLNEKRHKELIEVLKKILLKLETTSVSKAIEVSINKLLDNTAKTDIPSSITAIGKVIVDKLEELKTTRNKEWKFKIERNDLGYISSVIAKQE